MVGWLVVVACRLYLARHLFTLYSKETAVTVPVSEKGKTTEVIHHDILPASLVFFSMLCLASTVWLTTITNVFNVVRHVVNMKKI